MYVITNLGLIRFIIASSKISLKYEINPFFDPSINIDNTNSFLKNF